ARARPAHPAGGLEELVLALDRARSGHDHDVLAADLDAAGIDDGLLRPEGAAGEFVRLADADDFLDPVHQLVLARVDLLYLADDAEDRLLRPRGAMDVEPAGGQVRHDMLDVAFGGVFLHHDDHGFSWTPG